MADFKSIWDSVVNKNDLPDIVASVTSDALNDYLTIHRNHKGDKELYRRDEVFKDAQNKTLFEAIIIVGGDQAAHDGGNAKPLSIELSNAVALPASIGMAYQYPLTKGQDEKNAVIRAPAVNFVLSWPSTTSTTAWQTTLSVDFELDVNLQLKEVEGDDGKPQQVIQIEPLKLIVSKQALKDARAQISNASAGQNAIGKVPAPKAKRAAPTDDQKVQDLFLAILNLAATYVGPNLARAVKIPLLHISQYELRPTFFKIAKGCVNVGAKLNLAPIVQQLQHQVNSLQQEFWLHAQIDLASQSGSPAARVKPKFPRAEAFLRSYQKGLEDKKKAAAALANPPGKWAVSPRRGADRQVAVAANEFLINMISSKIGNVHNSGRTSQLSLWPPIPIRGSAGYEINVGSITVQIVPITSDPAGHGYLKGSAPISLFAGIYFQIWGSGCDPSWGDEKKIGLGVAGTPVLDLATKPSNGLSIAAQIDLSGVSFNTGLGSPIDDLIGALTSPLMGLLQTVVNVIADGMSFIVFRAVEKIPHQQTAVALSDFNTYQYSLKGTPTSPRNNYAMFVANTAAQ